MSKSTRELQEQTEDEFPGYVALEEFIRSIDLQSVHDGMRRWFNATPTTEPSQTWESLARKTLLKFVEQEYSTDMADRIEIEMQHVIDLAIRDLKQSKRGAAFNRSDTMVDKEKIIQDVSESLRRTEKSKRVEVTLPIDLYNKFQRVREESVRLVGVKHAYQLEGDEGDFSWRKARNHFKKADFEATRLKEATGQTELYRWENLVNHMAEAERYLEESRVDGSSEVASELSYVATEIESVIDEASPDYNPF